MDAPALEDNRKGIESILWAAARGAFAITISDAHRPAELAESLRRMGYDVELRPRGPADALAPCVVHVSWALRH